MPGTIHKLKVWTEFYVDLESGLKKFEIRINDRDYKVGDYLLLCDYNKNTDEYSGKEIFKQITYIVEGFGLKDGYICLGIE